MTMDTCCICRRRRKVSCRLDGYHGIGKAYEPCCRQCFGTIEHDGHGNPKHPKRYARALRRYMDKKEEGQ